ncbi:MAG: hypothetical protein SCARUB_00538 [Candidatus Scalindua rubra]|uniref:Uncharacterized protein n=1 Tax=Candidatus Scalindua rubra TaxID=1872076 RepID=A0A1E3XFB4_9BACT|nr:MAG: hypothetical protein SCARUB_00538 [Candidatus Scalindua rubra]
MPLVVGEWDVLKVVGKLKSASRVEISRAVGVSPSNLVYICSYLLREGYLKLVGRERYALSQKGSNADMAMTDVREPTLEKSQIKLDYKIVKEVANEVAEELGKKIKVYKIYEERAKEEKRKKEIKIRTDYIPSVEDETKKLESNIEKIGIETEVEKSDIDKSVKLFKNIKKGKKV